MQAIEKVHQASTDTQPLLVLGHILYVVAQRSDQRKQGWSVSSPCPRAVNLHKALTPNSGIRCKKVTQLRTLLIPDLHKTEGLQVTVVRRAQRKTGSLKQLLI